MYKRKARILFLCADNSCRSQMAEGYANALGSDRVEAKSAGIEAHNKNPRAISIMAEDGVDISQQESTVVDNDIMEWADLIVTVSAYANEHCPATPPTALKKYWPMDDPAKSTGSEEEITEQFREVRNEIKRRVNSLLGGLRMMEK